MATQQDNVRAEMESTLNTFLHSPSLAVQSRDATIFSSKLAPTCKRHLRPGTFPAAYPDMVKAEETNAEYEARMGLQLAALEETRCTVQDCVINHVKRKASVRVEQFVKPLGREGSTMEIGWFVDFTEDGSEITSIVEFIDTALSTKVLEEMLSASGKQRD